MNTTMDKLTGYYYGTEYFGKLRRVLLHRPVKSLELINESNHFNWLFDEVPDIEKFLREHEEYENLLRACKVEVLELSHYVFENRHLADHLPNLVYMHDSSVISRQGAILSKMAFMGRKNEDIVLKEALENLNVPTFYEFDEDDHFEGCLLLSPETILIANTERHHWKSIAKFIPHALRLFKEVIYVEIPQHRRFMHPDTIYNRVDHELALVFLPAFLRTYLIKKDSIEYLDDFQKFMQARGIDLINISDEEQHKWGCTFVPLEPGVMIHYDIALNAKTKRKLQQRGVELIEFHPHALLAGGGSLRCLTLRLLRD